MTRAATALLLATSLIALAACKKPLWESMDERHGPLFAPNDAARQKAWDEAGAAGDASALLVWQSMVRRGYRTEAACQALATHGGDEAVDRLLQVRSAANRAAVDAAITQAGGPDPEAMVLRALERPLAATPADMWRIRQSALDWMGDKVHGLPARATWTEAMARLFLDPDACPDPAEVQADTVDVTLGFGFPTAPLDRPDDPPPTLPWLADLDETLRPRLAQSLLQIAAAGYPPLCERLLIQIYAQDPPRAASLLLQSPDWPRANLAARFLRLLRPPVDAAASLRTLTDSQLPRAAAAVALEPTHPHLAAILYARLLDLDNPAPARALGLSLLGFDASGLPADLTPAQSEVRLSMQEQTFNLTRDRDLALLRDRASDPALALESYPSIHKANARIWREDVGQARRCLGAAPDQATFDALIEALTAGQARDSFEEALMARFDLTVAQAEECARFYEVAAIERLLRRACLGAWTSPRQGAQPLRPGKLRDSLYAAPDGRLMATFAQDLDPGQPLRARLDPLADDPDAPTADRFAAASLTALRDAGHLLVFEAAEAP